MRKRYDVYLATHRHPVQLAGTGAIPLNLESPGQLEHQLQELRPGLVVHTAGVANVDLCEQNPDEAMRVNAVLAENVALVARKLKIKLIHISTDHLFTGDSMYYREDEPAVPLNVYGKSKLMAEQLVQQANPETLLVRTNFFGWGHPGRQSFSDWILSGLRARRTITMFDDAFFTPILADRLAMGAHELAERGVSGIFNLSGDERISKYDFGVQLAEVFRLPATLIKRGKISDAGLIAVRPRDMSLDTGKATSLLGRKLGTPHESLVDLYRQEQEGRPAELFRATTVIETTK